MAKDPTATRLQSDIIIDPVLASVSNYNDNGDAHKFGTVEIASLADLLSGLGRHDRAIDVVMRGAQWLGQFVDADASYSERDRLDINLRMRLASAELRLGVESGKASVSHAASESVWLIQPHRNMRLSFYPMTVTNSSSFTPSLLICTLRLDPFRKR